MLTESVLQHITETRISS